VGLLLVKIPDLGLLVEELKRVAQSSPSIYDVKSLIWQINSFGPSGQTLDKLFGFDILPVRKADGTLKLLSKSHRFSIIDRQHLGDAFKGKLDFLDFSLKEVRILLPFLSCMGLETRYLSEIVVEKSSFRGVILEPSAEKTKHLRRRAHALSR
jgi:hypothetical protein